MIIHAQQKEIFDGETVVARQFPGGDLIQRYGDRPDAVLCQNQTEQAVKRIRVHALRA